MPALKQKTFLLIAIFLLAGTLSYSYSVTRVRADDFYSLKNTPHACSTQSECDALNAGAGSSGTLNSQNAPHVYPPDQTDTQSSGSSKSGKAAQDCYATVEEYVNATPNMGNFDKPICPGADSGNTGSSNSQNSSLDQFDTSAEKAQKDQLSQFDSFDYPTSATRMPPGTQISTDLEALKAQLKPGQTIIHLPEYDKDQLGQGQAYAIVDNKDVQAFENSLNSQNRWVYDEQGAAKSFGLGLDDGVVKGFIGSVLSDLGLFSTGARWSMKDYPEFVESNGTNYASYNSIMDYVGTLQGGTSESNIENIYNKVQDTIVGRGTVNDFSMAQSLETGLGVCRHEATVLAEALATAGYNSSLVFGETHAWVRVNYNGGTFDLDPNGYQTYIQLPARTIGGDYQIIPVKGTPKKSGFLWPLVSTVYASTGTDMPSVTATTTTKKVCGKIGICLNIQLPAHIQANSSTTLEVWQATGNDWTITTFLKNPDIKMDFSKVQPVTINILDQDRLAKEHTTVSNGQTVYTLYSNINGSNGELIILQIISNKSILQNEDLLAMLAGNNQISKSVINQVPPTSTTYFSGKNLVIILALIGLVIIGLIGFFVLSKHKHITNVENQS